MTDLSNKNNAETITVTDDLTMAERAQLLVIRSPGRLEFNWHIPTAAAAIELALLGKIGTVANSSFFNGGIPLKLTVTDSAPTGNGILDLALQVLVARGKPWAPAKYLMSAGDAVCPAVHEALEARGIVTIVAGPSKYSGHLVIADDAAFAAAQHPASRARSRPELVVDPTLAGIVDVMRNSGNRFKEESGEQPLTLRDWYPAAAKDTITAILEGERLNAESQ